MAALLDVRGGPSESINQKIAQPLFSAFKIVGRIERPQHIVAGNLPVERRNEPLKSRRAHRGVHVLFVHYSIVTARLIS